MTLEFGRGDEFDVAFNSEIKKQYVKLINEESDAILQNLKETTPKATGLTSESWVKETYGNSILLENTNVVHGWLSIAKILYYGHGNGKGGWTSGRDYISPALEAPLKRIMKKIDVEVLNGK